MYVIAASSFLAIFLFEVSFPLIVITAGLLGFIGARSLPSVPAPQTVRPSLARALRVTSLCLALWLLPVIGLAIWLGTNHVYVQEGVFFSKMAVVTFGGAYAVLAYVAQQAVDSYGWLAPGEMLDGLGLAETTPGPLIMVVQFVGFLGAYRNPGTLDPFVAGTLGALLTTWVTFVPCFLWIFLGAPYVEALRGNRALTAALSAITAAVVGVILNLAVWFGLHVVFGTVDDISLYGASLSVPDISTIQPGTLLLTVAALVAMLRFKLGMLPVLAVSAIIGTVWQLVL
jgi:chromate transporter